MTTCTLVAGAILCVFSGPPPSPQASAALLAPHQYVHVPKADGPRVAIVASDPKDGPYGPLTVSSPSLRLDGSRWEDPPWQATVYLDRWGGGSRGRSTSMPITIAVK